MKNENNLYNYSNPKSGNEETNFFNIKGRITTKAFFLRLLLALGVYGFSWLIFNFEIHKKFGIRFEILVETIYLYILPTILIVFVFIQGVKRVHDVNKSGWCFLIPFYNLYLCFLEGTIGSNNYGVDPKPMAKVTYFDELESNDVEAKTGPCFTYFNNSELIIVFFGVLIIGFIFSVNLDTTNNINSRALIDSSSVTPVDTVAISSPAESKLIRDKHTSNNIDNSKKNNQNDSPNVYNGTVDSLVDVDIPIKEEKVSNDELPRSIDRYYKVLASDSNPVYFYWLPNKKAKLNTYFTTPEIIHTKFMKNGFIYIEFTNSEGQTSKGWLSISDLKLL